MQSLQWTKMNQNIRINLEQGAIKRKENGDRKKTFIIKVHVPTESHHVISSKRN